MARDADLRREIAREREQLTGAVAELRTELAKAKRRIPALVGGGLAALAVLRFGIGKLRGR